MQQRKLFVLMEEVMQQMNWNYQQLMGHIYGLATGGELDEAWVTRWLERQLTLIKKKDEYEYDQKLFKVQSTGDFHC